MSRVLFEEAVPESAWIGHAEDFVTVRVAAPAGQVLGGEIGTVLVDGPDPLEPERATGHILDLVGRPEGVATRTPARAARRLVRFANRPDRSPVEAGFEPGSGARR